MNVLVFIPEITQEFGGVKQYTYSILGILNQENENSYYIYTKEPKAYLEYTNLIFINFIGEKQNLINRLVYKLASLISYYLITRIIRLDYYFIYQDVISKDILQKYKIDIVYSPIQSIPKGNFLKILTMHDVQELHFPAFFSAEERKYRAIYYKKFISDADIIVVSYEHVKTDIVKFFNTTPDKIVILPHSFNKNWFDKYIGSDTKEVVKKYHLPSLFFLYPAATWEHKNHFRLLESLIYIKEKIGLQINLVCTGNKTEYFVNTLEPFILKNGLENNVIFTGIINDFDLYCMYCESHGVIIPSRYEAGSYPLYESIFLGIPVICSNTTSLPDTIGDDRFVFNPNNIVDMANKIVLLFSNWDYRNENIQNALNRATKLKKPEDLQIVRNIMRKLFEMKRATE